MEQLSETSSISLPLMMDTKPTYPQDDSDPDYHRQSPTLTDLVGCLSRSASATVMTTIANAELHMRHEATPGQTAVASCTAMAAAAKASTNTPHSTPEEEAESEPAQFEEEYIPTNTPDSSSIVQSDSSIHEEEEEMERQTIRSERTLTEPAPRTLHVWEADRQALECRRCARRFNFLVRRHHCRRCGLVVCDRCSGHRIRLPFEHIIQDPVTDPSHQALVAMYPQRVCDACVRPIAKNAIPPLGRFESPVVASPMQRSQSAQSLMAECPVCGANFMGMRQNDQEHHLQQCLNTGSPPVRLVRYVGKFLKKNFFMCLIVVQFISCQVTLLN
ncbi:FYVE zinc finger-domain-containing protein [Phycomyces nitens]|nr:FYVE zinc finger-domain-containing protein [Phycomyces nitens]